MAASVTLGIWNSNQFQRIKIDNVDLQTKVLSFRTEAAKKLEPNSTNIELAYCGVILEDDKTLASYGITPGGVIHVLQKKPPPIVTLPKKLTEAEVQPLVVAFRTFTLSSGYRASLQKLARPDVMDKILAAVPGLAEDPAAIALIQDPELIVHLADPDTVRKVAEQHPVLIDAARFIANNIHDVVTPGNPNQASTSTGYSYSLDALSDDDDMDSNSDTSSQQPLTRNESYNAITAAQLAAAIANATNTAFNTNSAGMPSDGTPTTTGGNVITNEMFTNAIQQAFATSPFGSASTTAFPPATTPSRSDEETLENITRRLQPQLQQMHEMGLLNDSVNVRALQATSGDVRAAIELVFNNVID